jgi:hypothetical protein
MLLLSSIWPIWDKPALLDWTFAQYNSANAGVTIRNFLAQSGAKSATVPYRTNRAVIFDSDLFHETDKITSAGFRADSERC